MPERIQRKRTKGWRMPEGAVYVGRPSKWGNFYRIDSRKPEEAVEMYRDLIERVSRDTVDPVFRHDGLGVWDRDIKANIRRELAGKDLVCWCYPTHPCHADVLLELANGATS